MGILKPKSEKDGSKRKSLQPDFSNLAPLKPGGAVGFLNFREGDSNKSGKKSKKGNESDMDSDDDEDDPVVNKAEEDETKEGQTNLTADDIRRQGELAEGVRKIKVRLKCVRGAFFMALANGRYLRSLNVNTLQMR